jgi:TPR repeat protein
VEQAIHYYGLAAAQGDLMADYALKKLNAK